MPKIILTDEIINDSFAKKCSVDDIMRTKYEGEIQDRIGKNEQFKNFTPLDFALFDANIKGSSTISDFSTADAGEWLLPTFIDTRLRETVAASSMISYVTTMTSGVDGLSILGATLDLIDDSKNKDATKKKRVSEGADLPLAKIGLGETSMRLFKRGRAVEATYEALKYLRVDLFTKTIESIANDVSDQQMGDAINTLIKGDGNDNAIESLATTETANIFTSNDLIEAMIAFQDQAKKPITTILANKSAYKQIFKLKYKTDEGNGADNRFMINTPQYDNQDVSLIYDSRVPQIGGKDIAIFLNKEDALIKYISNGSNIREMSRNIRNQTQLGTISETSNFGKFNKKSCGTLVSK